MREKRNKIWLKITAFTVIQVFILLGAQGSFAGAAIREDMQAVKSTLAPNIGISGSGIRLGFKTAGLEGNDHSKLELPEPGVKQEEKKTVLLVDDEPKIRELFKEILESAGYKVVTASDGQEGLEKYRKNMPDLVITDLDMPKMEGNELAVEIRKINPVQRIILVSGEPQYMLDKLKKEVGFNGVMQKPVKIKDLEKVVSDVISAELTLNEIKAIRGMAQEARQRLMPLLSEQQKNILEIVPGHFDPRFYLSHLLEKDIRGQTFIVRPDINILDLKGGIKSLARLEQSMPTIKFITEKGGRVVLIFHVGKPKGKVVSALSAKKIADEVGKKLEKKVTFVPAQTQDDGSGSIVTEEAIKTVESMKDGDVVMLDNVRFDPREEAGEMSLAEEYAKLGKYFVLDGFGVIHRGSQASLKAGGVKEIIPLKGLLVEKEEEGSWGAISPEMPVLNIFGGAKIIDEVKRDEAGKIKEKGKITLIEKTIQRFPNEPNTAPDKMNKIFIGGKMAFYFIAALKELLDDSRVDAEALQRLMPEGLVSQLRGKEISFGKSIDIKNTKGKIRDLEPGKKLKEEVTDRDQIDIAKRILLTAITNNVPLLLPVDFVEAEQFNATSDEISNTVGVNISEGRYGFDVGNNTYEDLISELQTGNFRTVSWNGPLGLSDIKSRDGKYVFDKSHKFVKEIAGLTGKGEIKTYIGGGETRKVAEDDSVVDFLTWASTAGGGYLDFVETGGNSSAYRIFDRYINPEDSANKLANELPGISEKVPQAGRIRHTSEAKNLILQAI